MNDEELDLWLSVHNHQLDAQINANIDLESRREQVRTATASEPRGDEADMADVHAIWSEQFPRRVPSVTKLSATRPVPLCNRKSVIHSAAVVLLVLFVLASSAVLGDLAGQWGAAPAPEPGNSVVIGVPSDMSSSGMPQEAQRYGFAYDLANWLVDDLHYSPVTLYSFSDLDGLHFDHTEMVRSGEVDMFLTPTSTAGQRGAGISFAGPYLITQGGVLVRADSTAIHSVEDLDGKRVCVWNESTYKKQSTRLGNSVPVEKRYLSACVEALAAGSVDAVAGDQIILSEVAKVEKATALSVVPGVSFGGQQSYGIALEKGNAGQCDKIRDAIRQFITSGAWDHAFQLTMPDVPPAAYKPDPDHLDRCE
jgi:glutamate transport system substrate-binding protein